ncbi:conserved hypothetical protein [Histoplasma capsulatum var. duboisii H88]|uniref:Uncharacterized protein n=1 Tax=Ajellomyces capsulatus (strain H88) TaxID=544711 RepID=F0UPQ5_AJEC8|nr:conserved hypothetical protein [Histoplasma capsulatum var. duboisii H88]
MPSSVTSKPPRKRQYPKPHPSDRSRFQKRQKLDAPASSYWDNLLKIWLTKDALEELDRRNSRLKPPQNHHRPVTRRFCTELKKRCNPFQFVLDFLQMYVTTNPCKYIIADNIAQYSKPENFLERAISSRSQSRKRRECSPPSTSADTRSANKSTSTTPYNRNFQQNLIDHGVYPDGYEYPDGRIPAILEDQ